MAIPDDEPDLPSGPSAIWRTAVVAVFALIAGLIGTDLVADWRSGGEALHLGLEGLAMGLAACGAALVVLSMVQERRRAADALFEARQQGDALRLRADQLATAAARWRKEAETALLGLGAAISQQFERWALTPAEAEVALLLLKGLTTKEIAQLRETSDRTVRQQARGIYAKAGLAGRAELAAFFLKDLLLPP